MIRQVGARNQHTLDGHRFLDSHHAIAPHELDVPTDGVQRRTNLLSTLSGTSDEEDVRTTLAAYSLQERRKTGDFVDVGVFGDDVSTQFQETGRESRAYTTTIVVVLVEDGHSLGGELFASPLGQTSSVK